MVFTTKIDAISANRRVAEREREREREREGERESESERARYLLMTRDK